MRNYLDLLWAMTEKELKVRYKKTILGFLWIILNPLLLMSIIGFLFSFFIKIPNYYLFLLAGLIPWTFFSNSINESTNSIVNERRLLHKAKFPIELIPISVVLANIIHLLISIILLIIIIFIIQGVVFAKLILLLPALLLIVLFTLSLSLIVSTLYVKYRDVGYLVRTGLILAFYATPIIYNIGLIPSGIRDFFVFNPLAGVFELFRFSLFNQGEINLKILSLNVIVITIFVLLGIYTFNKEKNFFVDWI